MFPIPFNFPFIKKNGERTTIGDAISNAGSTYTLPTASADTKGGVKIGSGLTMTGDVLSNNNPTPYSLPAASDEILGGIKVGAGLSILNGVLSATGGGAAIHAFLCNCSNNDYKKLLLITTNSTVTDATSFLDGLKHGFALNLIKADASNVRVPIMWYTGNNPERVDETYTYQNDAVRIAYWTGAFNFSGTISNVVQLF